jgi:carbon monoxide dehydrogenase subunit G
MGAVNSTVTVPATPDHVWELIVTPATYEKWLTIHTKWKSEVPETFTQGAQVAEVVTMLGMANTITWTVDELEAPARLRISGTGMAGVKTSFTLEVGADGNGASSVSIDAMFEGQMIAGALGKAVEKDAKENLDRSLQNIAALVS